MIFRRPFQQAPKQRLPGQWAVKLAPIGLALGEGRLENLAIAKAFPPPGSQRSLSGLPLGLPSLPPLP